MTQQDIFNHFGSHVMTVAAIFGCTRRRVYDWGEMEIVPEVISLRADFMTNGALPHKPELYGAEYKRGEYEQSADSPAESKQVS